MKYEVYLRRVVHEFARVEVEAPNAMMAHKAAMAIPADEMDWCDARPGRRSLNGQPKPVEDFPKTMS